MTESRSQAVTANSADRLSARIAVLQAEQAVAEKRLEIARLTEQAMSEAEGTLRERSVETSSSPAMREEVFQEAGELHEAVAAQDTSLIDFDDDVVAPSSVAVPTPTETHTVVGVESQPSEGEASHRSTHVTSESAVGLHHAEACQASTPPPVDVVIDAHVERDSDVQHVRAFTPAHSYHYQAPPCVVQDPIHEHLNEPPFHQPEPQAQAQTQVLQRTIEHTTAVVADATYADYLSESIQRGIGPEPWDRTFVERQQLPRSSTGSSLRSVEREFRAKEVAYQQQLLQLQTMIDESAIVEKRRQRDAYALQTNLEEAEASRAMVELACDKQARDLAAERERNDELARSMTELRQRLFAAEYALRESRARQRRAPKSGSVTEPVREVQGLPVVQPQPAQVHEERRERCESTASTRHSGIPSTTSPSHPHASMPVPAPRKHRRDTSARARGYMTVSDSDSESGPRGYSSARATETCTGGKGAASNASEVEDAYMSGCTSTTGTITGSTVNSNPARQMADLASEFVGAITQALRQGQTSQVENSNAGIRQLAARQSSTSSKLPIFSGKPEEWPAFLALYRSSTEQCAYSNAENVQRLQTCLKGPAQEAVQLLLAVPDNVDEAIRTLERRFGRPELVVKQLIEQAKALKPARAEDTDALHSLATSVRNIVLTMKLLKSHGHRNNPALRDELVAKLSLPHRMQWGEYVKAKGLSTDELDLGVLSEWLAERAEAASLVTPTSTKTAAVQPTPPPRRSTTLAAVTAGTTRDATSDSPRKKKSCRKCMEEHAMAQCKEFQQLPVQKRSELVRLLGLCVNCLQDGHFARNCTSSHCRKCKGKHNTLLHRDDSDRPSSGSQQNAARTNTANMASAASALHAETPANLPALMTTVGTVRCGDVELQATIMLDSGSTCSFITTDMAEKLNVPPGETTSVRTTVLGGSCLQHESRIAPIEICHKDSTATTPVQAVVLPQITADMQRVDWDAQKASWPHLRGMNPDTPANPTVDILLGLDVPQLHASLAERRGPGHGPIARKTPLGWICFGLLEGSGTSAEPTVHHATHAAIAEPTEPTLELNAMVRSMFNLDTIRSTATGETMSRAEREAEKVTDDTMSLNNNRVTIGIPWVAEDRKPHVTSNRPMAQQRLASLQRSLYKRPELAAAYAGVIQQYLTKGYIREVPETEVHNDADDQWFLPHFPVIKEDRTTTKVRIVFDAAAKKNDVSINEEMHAGPALQNNIVSCLLKFCKEPVALMADISEMFLQVELAERDRRYHRFLWEVDGRAKVFEFQRVCFGCKASPYLAGKAVQAVAATYAAEGSPTHTIIMDNLYVDDLLASAPTPEAAVGLRTDVQETLAKGGFHLRKWMSNSAEVMKSVPEADRAPNTLISVADHQHPTLPCVKTLGVAWDAESDHFTFKYQVPVITQYTKRTVLSKMASLFDPRGQVSPYTIRAKVMFQDACLRGLEWDEEFAEPEAKGWRKFFEELPKLEAVRATRSFKDPNRDPADAELSLHVFVDASDAAVATAVYVRASYPDGMARSTLAMAKAKPAPLHRQSIPMLELRAAVLGAEVAEQVAQALGISSSDITYWSDSLNVLYWLRSHSRRFKVEVGNRVSKIQALSDPRQWRHVPTSINPADKGTRGLSAAQLASDDDWWHGPKFLRGPESAFPARPIEVPSSLPAELKKRSAMSFSAVPGKYQLDPSNFSSWTRLIRVTAWCQCFVRNVRIPREAGANRPTPAPRRKFGSAKSVNGMTVPALSPAEVQAADVFWVRKAQEEVYGKVIKRLESGKEPDPNEPLLKLRPQLEEVHGTTVLTVGGRLTTAHHLPLTTRHPIILPPKHRVTALIVDDEDERCQHSMGPNHLLANLSNRYWLINGKSVVRQHRHRCVKCRRGYAKALTPIMGGLPDYRTSSPLIAFSKVTIDFAGPFLTRQGRGKVQQKRYICVFSCLLTRAVHLEPVNSLDTDGFLMAMTRFCKRRGTPEFIVTDNGSNFTAAERQLREATCTIDQDRLTTHSELRDVQWHFNPPRTPHFGGVVETMVKAVKRALWHVLHQAGLTDEEFSTALVHAEAMLNSRPLTTVSSDSDDPEALTPNHFLMGRAAAVTHLEAETEDLEKVHPRRRWLFLQVLTRQVWKRWLREMVPALNVRSKWYRKAKDVEEGEVFLVMDESTPRATWPLGRVPATYPGQDGVVRAVNVKIKGKEYRRSVHRLIPLEVTEGEVELDSENCPATANVNVDNVTS